MTPGGTRGALSTDAAGGLIFFPVWQDYAFSGMGLPRRLYMVFLTALMMFS